MCSSTPLSNGAATASGIDALRAGSGKPAGWARRGWERLGRWRQLRHERQQLWRLSDAALKDIGLSRADVVREASRSFWDTAGWNR